MSATRASLLGFKDRGNNDCQPAVILNPDAHKSRPQYNDCDFLSTSYPFDINRTPASHVSGEV